MRTVGGKIEVRVAKLPWPFPESVHAVTVWPLIFYEPPVWDDPCLQAHERYHWVDQARWLVLPWFAAYFVLKVFYGGGREHPLEREGYRRQDACRES